jgi:hypothetical protein
MMLDDLASAYPDAELVLTHRDPAKTMPSTVSTTAMVQWIRTDRVDLDMLSALIGAVFSNALSEVARRTREDALPLASGNIRFTDLMADPAEAVTRAYAELGRTVSSEHAAAIRAYVRDKPQGKFGHHRYTASEWGFDVAALRDDLRDYVTTFAIELEGQGG